MKLTTILGYLCLSTLANAQATISGCGAGITAWLTPNSIPVLRCEFGHACNAHDACYGKCEGLKPQLTSDECSYLQCKRGGLNYGRAVCEEDVTLVNSLVEAKTRRGKCDVAFMTDLRKLNVDSPPCRAFAEVYVVAVQFLGEKHFAGARPSGPPVRQTRDQYDAVLRQFFALATDDQLTIVARKLESKDASLNLRAPIFFSRELGLINQQ